MRLAMSSRRVDATLDPTADCRAEPQKGFLPLASVPEKVRSGSKRE